MQTEIKTDIKTDTNPEIKTEALKIEYIPALIWGEPADRVIVAVHGNLSNKADRPIELLAEVATAKGYQVLSFDLPSHGDRRRGFVPCKIQYCVQDLRTTMAYAKERWHEVGLFANSMGAYFSLVAYAEEELSLCRFAAPVVNMVGLIERLMAKAGVTAEQLEMRQKIVISASQTLYWDYIQYVHDHPVVEWRSPTAILHSEGDEVSPFAEVADFAEHHGCELTALAGGEHYLHTPEQLAAYTDWLAASL